MSAESEAKQPRRGQRRTAPTPNVNDIDVSAQTGENPLPVDQLIEEVINSSRYKELLDVNFQGPQRREHRFRRALTRSTNSQVHDKDSWDEVQSAIRYFVSGQAIEHVLNMDVLGNLYSAERHALIRSLNDFFARGFSEDIARDLGQSRLRAVETLPGPEKDLHLKFSQRVFSETLFKRAR